MRAESSATCTSGEPVSVGLRPYWLTISDFCSDLRVIQQSSVATLVSGQSAVLLGSRASYRKIQCRSKQLTNKNPCRGEPVLCRYETDGNELPGVCVNLDLAARQRGIGRHRLAMGELGGLGRLEVGGRPAFESGLRRQQ